MMNDDAANPNQRHPDDFDELCEEYGLILTADAISKGDMGPEALTRYPWIMPDNFERDDDEFRLMMTKLLNKSLAQAATFIADASANYNGDYLSQHLDDHQDYLNAAIDQVNCIRDIFHDGDGENIPELTLKLLNLTQDEAYADNAGWGAMGFAYGYCDHFTPIATLARMNIDDEGEQGN